MKNDEQKKDNQRQWLDNRQQQVRNSQQWADNLAQQTRNQQQWAHNQAQQTRNQQQNSQNQAQKSLIEQILAKPELSKPVETTGIKGEITGIKGEITGLKSEFSAFETVIKPIKSFEIDAFGWLRKRVDFFKTDEDRLEEKVGVLERNVGRINERLLGRNSGGNGGRGARDEGMVGQIRRAETDVRRLQVELSYLIRDFQALV
ncbi:hypothetical protein BTM25_27140 [Actinomadura rubteroloni]|uniref:Uncharacterized protein n=1 Tax=Actinomadura rubteroloni TaxID=1926885 RepID=A0A2P4UGB1_9ACTN|nr:hypothetical protein [Actinomadura rubteroloni]POM24087.1 hypothetical protein BTM25_27140 [Actinomadura rubteroloni]